MPQQLVGIFVITMQDCESIFDKYKRYFNKINISKGNIYKAAEPVSQNFDKKKFSEIYKRTVKNGEIGCIQSHLEVLSRFLNGPESYCIVLEDDAILEAEFENKILDLVKNKESSIPFFGMLGHSKTVKRYLPFQRIMQPLIVSIETEQTKFGKNRYLNKFGTVGYILDREAAKLYLNFHKKNNFYLADDFHDFSSRTGVEIHHPFQPLLYEDLTTPSYVGNKLYVKHKITILNIGSAIKMQWRYLLGKC